MTALYQILQFAIEIIPGMTGFQADISNTGHDTAKLGLLRNYDRNSTVAAAQKKLKTLDPLHQRGLFAALQGHE